MKQIGASIRRERKRFGYTQAQLAEKTDLSRATLSMLENGVIHEIGIRKVIRVLEFLGLELTLRPFGAPPTLEELQQERIAE